MVNNKKINHLNYLIKGTDIVSFISTFKGQLYDILLQTIKPKRFFVQPPFYLEINYRTLCVMLIPKLVDAIYVPYPFFFKKNH